MSYAVVTSTARLAFMDTDKRERAARRVGHALRLPPGSRLAVSCDGVWTGYEVGSHPTAVFTRGRIAQVPGWLSRARTTGAS